MSYQTFDILTDNELKESLFFTFKITRSYYNSTRGANTIARRWKFRTFLIITLFNLKLLTQKEIATIIGCSQSLVSKTLNDKNTLSIYSKYSKDTEVES